MWRCINGGGCVYVECVRSHQGYNRSINPKKTLYGLIQAASLFQGASAQNASCVKLECCDSGRRAIEGHMQLMLLPATSPSAYKILQ